MERHYNEPTGASYSEAESPEYAEIEGDAVYEEMSVYDEVRRNIHQLLLASDYRSISLTKERKNAIDKTSDTNRAILEHFSRKIKTNGIGPVYEGLKCIAKKWIGLDAKNAELDQADREKMQIADLIELIAEWENGQIPQSSSIEFVPTASLTPPVLQQRTGQQSLRPQQPLPSSSASLSSLQSATSSSSPLPTSSASQLAFLSSSQSAASSSSSLPTPTTSQSASLSSLQSAASSPSPLPAPTTSQLAAFLPQRIQRDESNNSLYGTEDIAED